MPSRPLLREGAGITVRASSRPLADTSSNASKTLNLRLGIGINSCFDSWLLCGIFDRVGWPACVVGIALSLGLAALFTLRLKITPEH